MRQQCDDYSIRLYPFADDETPDSVLASMGYVNIVTNTALAMEQKLDDKVVFNIQLRALTRSEWRQLSETVETAFDMQASRQI